MAAMPRHSRDQASVVRAAKDILLKRLAQSLRGTFLTGLGLDLAPIIEVLPAELPVLSVRTHLPDLLFRLADGTILHVEFEITLSPTTCALLAVQLCGRRSLRGAGVYGGALWSRDSRRPTGACPGLASVHRAESVSRSTGRRGGRGSVACRRGQWGDRVSASERLDVMLLPLMRQRRPLSEVLEEVAQLARVLPQAEREEMIGTMVGFAYNYVEPAIADRLLEVLRMANVLEDLLVDTLVRGRAESSAKLSWAFLRGASVPCPTPSACVLIRSRIRTV